MDPVVASIAISFAFLIGCTFGARYLDWSSDAEGDKVTEGDVDIVSAAILRISKQQRGKS